MSPFLHGVRIQGERGHHYETGTGERRTQVMYAPLSDPKAAAHAGSRDWKYSSGWKKVQTRAAFTRRRRSSEARTLRVLAAAMVPGRSGAGGFVAAGLWRREQPRRQQTEGSTDEWC